MYRECFIAEKLYNSGLYYKSVTIVIYDHNDSCLYFNTEFAVYLVILAKAQANLTRIVSNDRKVFLKLKRTLMIVTH